MYYDITFINITVVSTEPHVYQHSAAHSLLGAFRCRSRDFTRLLEPGLRYASQMCTLSPSPPPPAPSAAPAPSPEAHAHEKPAAGIRDVECEGYTIHAHADVCFSFLVLFTAPHDAAPTLAICCPPERHDIATAAHSASSSTSAPPAGGEAACASASAASAAAERWNLPGFVIPKKGNCGVRLVDLFAAVRNSYSLLRSFY